MFLAFLENLAQVTFYVFLLLFVLGAVAFALENLAGRKAEEVVFDKPPPEPPSPPPPSPQPIVFVDTPVGRGMLIGYEGKYALVEMDGCYLVAVPVEELDKKPS